MPVADVKTYCTELVNILNTHWPENRTVNIVCHGHSVPAGYFATPIVDTFNAYPHLLHKALKHRFPFGVINVIVSAIGGENSESGSERFERDVLSHRPDVVTIDYGLNDRRIGLEKAQECWRSMIEKALERKARLILLTPTWDASGLEAASDDWKALVERADQIGRLAEEYSVGLADSFKAFEDYVASGGQLTDLLSWPNHPNRKGHELVTRELMHYFAILKVVA